MDTTLKQYLENKNATSAFSATLGDVGGNITFSNSGKRGSVKEFTLGLLSFISILKDIRSNIIIFKGHKSYVEKEWRDLGSEYFSDGPANSMSTVQTKPLFTTISKIIAWANYSNLEHIDTDQFMEIEEYALGTAIAKLESLAQTYLPKKRSGDLSTQSEKVIYEDKSIREFAKYVFTYFFGSDWKSVITSTKQNPSVINEIQFVSHDFDIFKRLIGEFSELQTKASLTSSNTIRYFDEPIFIEDSKYFYFSTQWNGDGDYSLSFLNLKGYFEDRYPEYRITKSGDIYYLLKISGAATDQLNLEEFYNAIYEAGLSFAFPMIARFTASLLTKPFVILTGLSGSGKTKIAEAFVKWICQDGNQYQIIPVGADWTNREPLLGYPNALNTLEYVKPETGVLDLILRANQNPDLPYFLILDEMNLSHVERYFADFLSVMETKGDIVLFSGEAKRSEVPPRVKFPSNLFIIGTVNIDETTNMFSPKVLDRANTIEFRVTQEEIKNFLGNVKDIRMDSLTGKGAGMARSFLEMAANKSFANSEEINTVLVEFFGELKKTGAEFGYRSATEILRLISCLTVLDEKLTTNQKVDIAIMQKLLPKLHGSRRKLCPVLEKLGALCVDSESKPLKDIFGNDDFDFNSNIVLYPLSLEKISRMYRSAVQNGFASYAEA